MNDWLTQILGTPNLLRMGHGQRVEDRNLGLGWLYYALGRILRPQNVVVIGSFRGFAPLVFARALADNVEKGTVTFIDPSLVDDFWKDAARVRQYFASFGSVNIRHVLMTTQQFVATQDYRDLGSVDILFVDGYHSEEQARFDFEAFRDRLSTDAIALFHDSRENKSSSIYGPNRVYEMGVKTFIDTLKKDGELQVFDLPFAQGVSLVRQVPRLTA